MVAFLPVVRIGGLTVIAAFLIIPSLEAFTCRYHHHCHRRPCDVTTRLLSNRAIPVLYESDRILIVNKPHGIAHHTTGKATKDDGESDLLGGSGILQLLRQQRRHTLDMTADTQHEQQRLWGVHRLDQVTSGILVLAKDPEMASMLSRQFAQGKIQKVYIGLSAKKPLKKKQGWVQGGMERTRDKGWKLVNANDDKSSHERHPNFAKTRFFTARIVHGTGTTVAMFRPLTGKTHQIRVAAKAMGIPLLGDPIYKDGGCKKTKDVAEMSTLHDEGIGHIRYDDNEFPTSRTMLHASGIHIPAMNEKGGEVQEDIDVWCPPPFFQEWRDTVDGDALVEALNMAVKNLMIKNCDVPGILEAMMKNEQQQQQSSGTTSQEELGQG